MNLPPRSLGQHIEDVHRLVNKVRRSHGRPPVLFSSKPRRVDLRINGIEDRRRQFAELCPGILLQLCDRAGAIGWIKLGAAVRIGTWKLKAIAEQGRIPTVGEVKAIYRFLGEALPAVCTHDFSQLRQMRKLKRVTGGDLAQLFDDKPHSVYYLETGKVDRVDSVTAAGVARWEIEQE